MFRVLKKNPELIEEFQDKAADLLHDKNQAVALSGVTLMLQICLMQPQVIERYRQHVPKLCTMLRSLLQVSSAAVSGRTAVSASLVPMAVQSASITACVCLQGT